MANSLTRYLLPPRLISAGSPPVPGIPPTPPTTARDYDTTVTSEQLVTLQFTPPSYPPTGLKTVGAPTAYKDPVTGKTTISLVVRKVVTQVVHVHVNGSPGTPGTAPRPGTPPVYSAGSAPGWTGGGHSVALMGLTGTYRFKVGVGSASVIGAAVGLRRGVPLQAFPATTHGLYVHGAQFSVIENGQLKGAPRAFNGGQFAITRAQGVVRYYYADELVYTSDLPIAGTGYYLNATLYSAGDSIQDPEFSSEAIAGTARGRGQMQPLGSVGGTELSSSGVGTMEPFTSEAEGGALQGGTQTLERLVSLGGNRPYATGSAAMQPFTSDGGQLWAAPAIAAGFGVLAPLLSSGRSLVAGTTLNPANALIDADARWEPSQWDGFTLRLLDGSGQLFTILTSFERALIVEGFAPPPLDGAPYDIVNPDGVVLYAGLVSNPLQQLVPLVSLGADRPYGGGSVSMEPFASQGFRFRPIDGLARLTMGAFSVYGYGGPVTPNSARLSMHPFTLRGWFGGQARFTSSAFTLSASGTVPAIGRASLTVGDFTLQGAGTVSQVGGARLTLAARFKVRGFSGGQASLTVASRFTVDAVGNGGTLGRARLTVGPFTLEASGSRANTGVARLTMPSLRAVPSGLGLMSMGAFRLSGSGHAEVAITYEAYAVNLKAGTIGRQEVNHQVTRYTDWPFNQVVRLGNRYFGVADNGLCLLGGPDNDGDPIPWAFRTMETDFETPELKNVGSVYLGGRLGSSALVTSYHGEEAGAAIAHQYTTPRSTAGQTHRQKFGKGDRSRYFAVQVEDADGGELDLDTMDFEVTPLKRKL